MEVIFLDIEGVLINGASLETTDAYFPDGKCLQLLNSLIKLSNGRTLANNG
jgi:hypothetical protein